MKQGLGMSTVNEHRALKEHTETCCTNPRKLWQLPKVRGLVGDFALDDELYNSDVHPETAYTRAEEELLILCSNVCVCGGGLGFWLAVGAGGALCAGIAVYLRKGEAGDHINHCGIAVGGTLAKRQFWCRD